MRAINQDVLGRLVAKAALEQLAGEFDVTASTAYHTAMAGLEPNIASLDDQEKEAVRAYLGAQVYTQDALIQIGGLSLGSTEASDEEKFAEGQQLLQRWFADNDVRVNPKYGIDPTGSGQTDTNLSVAVSEIATGGLEEQPGPAYVDALSGHLVCLD